MLKYAMVKFDINKFENSAKENGQRCWDALSFMKSLGYESWPSFHNVINKAMSSCAQLGINITDVFIPQKVIYGTKTISSYSLTRFACFLVSMHADSKKPEVAQAKVALAAIADALIQEKIHDGSLERIEIRDELKAGESIMSGTAKLGGLLPHQYGIFKDSGIRGMYNMKLSDLVSYKRSPGDKTLYDYMGKTELAANLFRVTQTAERIKSKNVKGLNSLSITAQDVGSEVREVMMKSSGVAPENLALEEDISHLKKRIKSANKEMKKMDGTLQPKKLSKKTNR
jgi:DNA-damage-inducible protein D